MSSAIEELHALYTKNSKHSNYQTLAPALRQLLGTDLCDSPSRFDTQRLEYITQKITFTGKNVLDIGANTGYFSFQAKELGAESVTAFEGNKEHALFLTLAIKALGSAAAKMKVEERYFDSSCFAGSKKYDITFLLNVIHHLGDDYGDPDTAQEDFSLQTARFLRSFGDISQILVLQMGYCWKGDRTRLLFTEGTKQNQLDFIREAIGDAWIIEHVGIAQKTPSGISYLDMNQTNMARDDSLKEFLNRPIFILSSTRNPGAPDAQGDNNTHLV